MIVLIPSFQPDHRLVGLVSQLSQVPGLSVLVVDDGSGPEFTPVFAQAVAAGAQLLSHQANQGKGAALRTGFGHVLAHHPGEPVVCADSDGQHLVLDILRVAAAVEAGDGLVLGVRDFRKPGVPARSRLGNALTAGVFTIFTGTKVGDTQTGLRGYAHTLLPWALAVGGDRYEYELNLLLAATRDRIAIRQVEIATVYLEQNASSHFRPVRDSLRIYRPLLAYAACSLAGFGLDAAILFTWYALTGQLLTAIVVARLFSGSANFLLNRHAVFDAGAAPLWPAAAKYALLAGGVLTANLAAMAVLTPLLGVVAAKLLTESALFLLAFVAQHRLVFTGRRPSASRPDRRPALPRRPPALAAKASP